MSGSEVSPALPREFRYALSLGSHPFQIPPPASPWSQGPMYSYSCDGRTHTRPKFAGGLPWSDKFVCVVHIYVYNRVVKRRELERRLRDWGWKLQRHGGKHDVWTNADGSFTEYVPRHGEVSERLARVILKRAKERK